MKITIQNIIFDLLQTQSLSPILTTVDKVMKELPLRIGYPINIVLNALRSSPEAVTYDNEKKKLLDAYKEKGAAITPETKITDIEGLQELQFMTVNTNIDKALIKYSDLPDTVTADLFDVLNMFVEFIPDEKNIKGE